MKIAQINSACRISDHFITMSDVNVLPENAQNETACSLLRADFKCPKNRKELRISDDAEDYSVSCKDKIIEADCRFWRIWMPVRILSFDHRRV